MQITHPNHISIPHKPLFETARVCNEGCYNEFNVNISVLNFHLQAELDCFLSVQSEERGNTKCR